MPAGADAAGADERGITLQTLIVTAVLVLMAVAAGVVIVAITNSSSDDLEESGSELEGRCNSVEIFDPEVAARGKKGANYANTAGPDLEPGTADDITAAFQSERIGCIPVCVWVNSKGEGDDIRLDPGEVTFHRERFPGTISVYGNPVFLDSAQFLFSGDRGEVAIYVGDSDARVITRGERFWHDRYFFAAEIDRVAVAPSGDECHTYDADGNVLLG